jgi:S-phase kinase-associated protein 1
MTSAANFLAMEPLLDLCCKTIAGHMTGLSTEELRAKFGIVNDFTPEEEARMRAEFGWADE